MKNELHKIIGVFIGGVVLAVAISASAFVYPDTAPPGYSVANPVYAPLHVGDVAQQKIGGLGLCSGWSPTVVCLDVGGKIYAEGDLELETGVITAVNGRITFVASGGVVIPSVADINSVSSAPNGTVLYSTDDNKFNFRTSGAWVQFP